MKYLIILVLPICLLAQFNERRFSLDSCLADYKPHESLNGVLVIEGTWVFDELHEVWVSGFKHHHKNLEVKIGNSRGSSVAMLHLSNLNSKMSLGLMSRRPKKPELLKLQSLNANLRVIQCLIAMQSIGVYVNKGNPLAERGLSLAELDAIFSKTRKRKYPIPITKWSQLGVNNNSDIKLFLPSTIHLSWYVIKKDVMLKGEYRDNYKMGIKNRNIVDILKSSADHIVFGTTDYDRSDYASYVPLRKTKGAKAYLPNIGNCLNQRYPLNRHLYMTFAVSKNHKISKEAYEYLKFIYSRKGQELAIGYGYYPLNRKTIDKELAQLNDYL